MTKQELRETLRARLAAVSAEELQERSLAVCRRLFEQPEYSRAEIVMLFLSQPHEVDSSRIALHAWSRMKRVVAPKVLWEQRRMLPIEIHSFDSDVRASERGVLEPIDGLPIPVGELDMVIVPGLGFDEDGHRVGRGHGFYDRFLAHNDYRGISCALALEEQLVDHIPPIDTDIRMDMLVTDKKVRRFKRRSRK